VDHAPDAVPERVAVTAEFVAEFAPRTSNHPHRLELTEALPVFNSQTNIIRRRPSRLLMALPQEVLLDEQAPHTLAMDLMTSHHAQMGPVFQTLRDHGVAYPRVVQTLNNTPRRSPLVCISLPPLNVRDDENDHASLSCVCVVEYIVTINK
jgi:hypothetical protein